MSGIFGVTGWGKRDDLQPVMKTMLRSAAHRGPDGAEIHLMGDTALGHLLLRTRRPEIDPLQPVSNRERSLWITLDGTIFNRDEVANGLRMSAATSDAMIFLAAYEEHGPDCLKEIDGIFSVAIWDDRRKVLFCARDPLGVKPFFYSQWNGSFLFASELNQIVTLPGFARRPNEAMVGLYLAADVNIHHETFFDQVYRLPAGSYAIVEKGKLQIKTYWDINPALQTVLPDDQAYGERFRELFQNAVKKNLEVDVPLGSSLSGGLDTSSIVCVADRYRKANGVLAPLETFSMAFEEKACDESSFIQAVGSITNTSHNQYTADKDDFFSTIPSVQERQGEPFRSIGVVLFWRLKQLSSQKRIRVLLSGMGADEVLGGLNLFYFADHLRQGRWLALRHELKVSAALDPYGFGFSPKRLLMHFGIKPLLSPALIRMRRKLQGNPFPDYIAPMFAEKVNLSERLFPVPRRHFKDLYRQASYEGLRHDYTPGLLHYEDMNNAGLGMEGRFPFLDKALVEYLFSIPRSQKIRESVPKIVLRNGMKGILPESVRTRTDRGAITKVFDYWLGHQYKREVERVLWGDRLKESGYLNTPRLRQIYEAHQAGRGSRYVIWRTYNLGVWLETFFK